MHHDTVLYANKKMQNVAAYIIKENLQVYIEEKFAHQLKRLIQEQLQTTTSK